MRKLIDARNRDGLVPRWIEPILEQAIESAPEFGVLKILFRNGVPQKYSVERDFLFTPLAIIKGGKGDE